MKTQQIIKKIETGNWNEKKQTIFAISEAIASYAKIIKATKGLECAKGKTLHYDAMEAADNAIRNVKWIIKTI